jgi:hypothetical protein
MFHCPQSVIAGLGFGIAFLIAMTPFYIHAWKLGQKERAENDR